MHNSPWLVMLAACMARLAGIHTVMLLVQVQAVGLTPSNRHSIFLLVSIVIVIIIRLAREAPTPSTCRRHNLDSAQTDKKPSSMESISRGFSFGCCITKQRSQQRLIDILSPGSLS